MICRTGIGASHAHFKARRLRHMSADVHSPELRRMMWNPPRHRHYLRLHHGAPTSPTAIILSSIAEHNRRALALRVAGAPGSIWLFEVSQYMAILGLFAKFLRCIFASHLPHSYCSLPPHCSRQTRFPPAVLAHRNARRPSRHGVQRTISRGGMPWKRILGMGPPGRRRGGSRRGTRSTPGATGRSRTLGGKRRGIRSTRGATRPIAGPGPPGTGAGGGPVLHRCYSRSEEHL